MIQYFNIVSNSIMTISLVVFIILLFGRSESLVNKLPKLEYWLLKIALAFAASGALFSALTNPTVTWTQFLRNAGLALLFFWAAIFHYKYFGNKYMVTTKKPITKNKSIKKAKND